jgi:glycosyltransferase involved in cell wall biosynthesis
MPVALSIRATDVRCPTLDQLPPAPPGKTGWPWTEETPPLTAGPTGGESWPRISVITPSYNQGRFLEETIRSVLLQGYPDLEYIIMDGGSTDGSLDIIRRYEPWLAYWVSQPDGGQTGAINVGWMRATGEILAYLNSDDYYLPGATTAAARAFCRSPDVAMVYGTASIVDEHGNELSKWEARPFDLKRMLTSGSIVPQPATFFSRSVVSGLGWLNETRQMIMDYELCTRIGMQFRTVCLPATLARFRAHGESKTWLQFETTARELLDFVMGLKPNGTSERAWTTLRSGTLSRVHYEWAMAYLARGQGGSKPLKQLLMSIRLYPRFALGRPLLTAHLAKQLVLTYLRPRKAGS